MNPLEAYLKELIEIRSSGAAVKETSYYGPLAHFLNEIGKTLKPKVHCILQIKNEGRGHSRRNLNLDAGDLELTAGWGHAGKGGVTTPGKGKVVELEYTPDLKRPFGCTSRAWRPASRRDRQTTSPCHRAGESTT
jgi:hypothetical protein